MIDKKIIISRTVSHYLWNNDFLTILLNDIQEFKNKAKTRPNTDKFTDLIFMFEYFTLKQKFGDNTIYVYTNNEFVATQIKR